LDILGDERTGKDPYCDDWVSSGNDP